MRIPGAEEDAVDDPTVLPPGLPVPEDDGAADHLPGMPVPDVALPSTARTSVRLDEASAQGRVVVFAYPRTSRPGEPPLVADWDAIPGARGCTPEACAIRDVHAELRRAGATVFGLSTQPVAEQQEVVRRLGLPYPLLSDAALKLTGALRLPTFEASGLVLLRRLTLVLGRGTVEHVVYPVFPPDEHPAEMLDWLRRHPPPVQAAG
jgi:peroxiredoxin